jgi:hypothetical protein
MFLSGKTRSLAFNENWVDEDFETYKYPFTDVAYIDLNKEGQLSYKPVVLEIISVHESPGSEKIIKVAFIDCKGNYEISAVYNFYVAKIDHNYKLKRILSYNTGNWSVHDFNKVKYHVSPDHTFNINRAHETNSTILSFEKYFEVKMDKITYFSCKNPEEVFKIKGFDYLPNMFFSTRGGLAEKFSNIIFSGNDSDVYDHEIVHLFTFKKFGGSVKPFIDEGLATYLGGSGGHSYDFHKKKFQRYLAEHPDTDVRQFMNPYLRNSDLDSETSLSYILGAVICEYAEGRGGKENINQLLKSGWDDSALWKEMEKVGLSRDTINTAIRQFLLK